MTPHIYLVSNSPGEVSTFVRPVLSELQRRHPQWLLRVCLVPCPYATGAEAKVLASWPESPQVWTPWQTSKAWWRQEGRGKRGAVVFLGGDPWHALLLKRSFQMPTLAYFPEPSSWEKTRWLGGFDKVALGYGGLSGEPDEYGRRGLGDLRVDAVSAQLLPTSSGRLTLALFPGSRRLHLKAALGPFLQVVDRVARADLDVILAASPFVSPEQLSDAAAKPWNLGLAFSRARLHENVLTTEAGHRVEVVWGRPYEVMARCDLALSLPGTNTAELAIAGKPTVVPLSTRVPVGGGGLLGILDRLPGLTTLKEKLKMRKKARISLVALPNQLAGRVVMPEFMVADDLRDLSDFVAELLTDPARRAEIGAKARQVMGPGGAAGRLVDLLEDLFV